MVHLIRVLTLIFLQIKSELLITSEDILEQDASYHKFHCSECSGYCGTRWRLHSLGVAHASFTVFVLHVALALLLVLLETLKEDSAPSPLNNASAIIGGYLLGLFSSIVLYRLSPFHRLHAFPGPRLAAVSKFWHVWQCRDSRNHELMERLHEKYGAFVHIGILRFLR